MRENGQKKAQKCPFSDQISVFEGRTTPNRNVYKKRSFKSSIFILSGAMNLIKYTSMDWKLMKF